MRMKIDAMAKERMTDAEQRIVDNIKDIPFKNLLTEGFLNGEYMTSDEFLEKLETLKESLRRQLSENG